MDFLLSQNNLYIVVIALVSGGMLLWPSLTKGRSGNAVSVQEAIQMANQRQAVFVDVRPPEQFKTGSIAQARNIPAAELAAKAAALPKNKPIILVCAQGRESARAVAALRKQGLEAVSLEGGLRSWTQGGLPLGNKA